MPQSTVPNHSNTSSPANLEALEESAEFIRRHLGPRPYEIADMLQTLGLSSLEQLIEQAIPQSIRSSDPLKLPSSRPEAETLRVLRRLASANLLAKSWLGLGYANTHTPTVLLRNSLENPGFYTAYTPYQAEISQGRLEALLNFQTMIIDLTGMEIANASLLDEATAAAEAMSMCHGLQAKLGRNVFAVSTHCHPQTIEVVQTRARPLGIEVSLVQDEWSFDGTCFGMLLQYPTTTGAVHDYRQLVARAHQDQVLVTVATDLLSLMLLEPPGAWGADVVVGNSQRFGVPLGFGGPHAAFFATREAHKRLIPGRMVGVSKDAHGKPALRLALQTREQHIRREKATSNICTAQVLLAVLASMYAVYHGPDGLRRIARRVHRMARLLAAGLRELKYQLVHDHFFDTIYLAVPEGDREEILERAGGRSINLRRLPQGVGIALDETTTRQDLEELWEVIGDAASPAVSLEELDRQLQETLPESLSRTSDFLTHPVFHRYHSETEMLRYLNRLQERDLSLTKSMIPLGSCTMKLNATTEMLPISWPEFSGIHPFAPLPQARGYLEMIHQLEAMLAEITGFAGVSLQPNAGSQGEYAGLLIIRHYHESRGEGGRDVCLIPSSAHGTNPASATMAGLRVVVVRCDEAGNIDLEDLRAKAEKHRQELAALMITYPSTHVVFEEGLVQICELIHEHGGQVYLDGANLNALVGLCRPGRLGVDVAHLNLHKTFCIPHGGGGPGVGPIGVARHLAPLMPRHSMVPEAGPETGISAVSAAPWGSASILPISWSYITLMGREGLEQATLVAILNANYIARRLDGHYQILYKGRNNLVAHECIVDLRPLKHSAGIEVDDVAKRLMDYGFHAPTMSWPVAGTLMIEPTESESKEELDRFCDAMISIREEIRRVEEGAADREDNPLKNAPHTLDALVGDWKHPYSRQEAVFPLPWVREHKFWPSVGRIDNAFGDRNLVCACPPVEDYL